MHITAKKTITEQSKSEGFLFREQPHGTAWLGLYAMLLVLAFYSESSIDRANGELHIELGGLVSWTGLVGAIVLFLDRYRRTRYAINDTGENRDLFFELSDIGIAYGLLHVWSKQYSWRMVTRVDCRGAQLTFHCPNNTVLCLADELAESQIAELLQFLSATRPTIRDKGLFGLSATPNTTSFGRYSAPG